MLELVAVVILLEEMQNFEVYSLGFFNNFPFCGTQKMKMFKDNPKYTLKIHLLIYDLSGYSHWTSHACQRIFSYSIYFSRCEGTLIQHSFLTLY